MSARKEGSPPRGKGRRGKAVGLGDEEPWRQGWDLTEERIEFFRERSNTSREAKARAMRGEGRPPVHPINTPQLDPTALMPQLPCNELKVLSLFSGGGGLDLGFDLAGYDHVASHDILPIAGETLRRNRSQWNVFAGPEEGDVCRRQWTPYLRKVHLIHGGPPCQPFSMAGRQLGDADTRDMIPEFVRAVKECRPAAFVMENVAALGQAKFRPYLDRVFYGPLAGLYHIDRREMRAEWFGVPQTRARLFFVGFSSATVLRGFHWPDPTHAFAGGSGEGAALPGLFDLFTPKAVLSTMGVREGLGLPDIGYDHLAPTFRSGFTGPRGATSINSSVAALKVWGRLGIWPNGVAANREAAHRFVPENGHFRLSVQDCSLLQGFPGSWTFCGPVYAILGQIGNSVAPPVAYQVAAAVARALMVM